MTDRQTDRQLDGKNIRMSFVFIEWEKSQSMCFVDCVCVRVCVRLCVHVCLQAHISVCMWVRVLVCDNVACGKLNWKKKLRSKSSDVKINDLPGKQCSHIKSEWKVGWKKQMLWLQNTITSHGVDTLGYLTILKELYILKEMAHCSITSKKWMWRDGSEQYTERERERERVREWERERVRERARESEREQEREWERKRERERERERERVREREWVSYSGTHQLRRILLPRSSYMVICGWRET